MTTKSHTFPPLKPLPLITLEQYEVLELNQDSGYKNLLADAKFEEERSKLFLTNARKKLKPNEFALPKSRKFPVPDKSHAANAKARASEMEHKGKISKETEEKIDAKANKVLKVKKKK